MKYDCIHKVCGKVAFYCSREYKPGDVVQSKDFTFLDGSKPTDGKFVICGSCKARINMSSTEIEFKKVLL